jgi:hypothetical protein
MTRRVALPITGGGSGSPEPSPALIDSVKRDLLPRANYEVVDSLPKPLRWRMGSIMRDCRGRVDGFSYR